MKMLCHKIGRDKPRKPFKKAVKILSDMKATEPSFLLPQASGRGIRSFRKLLLPEESKSNDEAIGYLESRGIDREVIDYCIGKHLLYQSEPYHNCIFIGFDEDDEARYTAFQRRWQMMYIQNNITGADHAKEKIQGSSIPWGDFASVINEEILDLNSELTNSEDKQLGAYFITKEELDTNKFPEKALKYLWDDAFKLERGKIFRDDIKSIGALICEYKAEVKKSRDPIKGVMKAEVYKKMMDMSANSIAEALDDSEVFETIDPDEEKK